MTDDLNCAFMKIEDDLITLEASAGVLYLAHADLDGHQQGSSALAQSMHFTAKSIEATCKRIRETLGEKPDGKDVAP